MSIALFVKVNDLEAKVAALEARILVLEAEPQPLPAEACTELQPKRKPGRPAKEAHGTATVTA